MKLRNDDTGVIIGFTDMRGKPKLFVQEGQTRRLYGTFTNELKALEFMQKLSEFVGATKEEFE